MSATRTLSPLPWCPDAPIDSLHPIAIPVTKAVKWHWRVKRWQIDVSYDDGAPQSYTVYTDAPTLDGGPEVTEECQLSLPCQQDTLQFVDPPGFFDHFELFAILDADAVALDGDDYRPWFRWSGVTATTDEDVTLTHPGGTLTIDGESITLYVTDGAAADNFTVTITPFETWPHVGDDNQPTWDTATGAQLLAPGRDG